MNLKLFNDPMVQRLNARPRSTGDVEEMAAQIFTELIILVFGAAVAFGAFLFWNSVVSKLLE